MRFAIWCLAMALCANCASGLNVLLFLLGTTQFERQSFEFLAQQLARRHHNTITVKPILIPEEPRLVQPRLHFVTEKVLKDLLPRQLYEPLQTIGGDVPWRANYAEDGVFYEPYWRAHVYACKKMLNSNLMEVLANDRIDVAILYVGNPCQLGVVHALGIPFVYVDLAGLSDETRVAAGAEWTPPTPQEGLEWFGARLRRAGALACELIAQEEPAAWLLDWLPCAGGGRAARLDTPISRLFAEDYAIRRRFHTGFPTVNQIKRRAAFFLANTDERLESRAERLPANLLLVGGMHIDQPRPLFSPWNETIAGAPHGVIVVSFGTQADTTRMPAALAAALFGALSRLTGYRVFWRLAPRLDLPGVGDVATPGNGTVAGPTIPPHFNFTTFLPQNELLAHRRTRLLVTNGGAHSVLEALAHGVPMLGLPLYGANRRTLARAADAGVAVVVERADTSERALRRALRQLLDDAKYRNAALEISREIRRRPASAFERALHAIELAAARRQPRGGSAPPSGAARALELFWRVNGDIWLAAATLTAVCLTVVAVAVRSVARLVTIAILTVLRLRWRLRKPNFLTSSTGFFAKMEKKNK